VFTPSECGDSGGSKNKQLKILFKKRGRGILTMKSSPVGSVKEGVRQKSGGGGRVLEIQKQARWVR